MGIEFILQTALFLAQAAVLICLPFALLMVASRAINLLQDARTRWTPYIELLALAVGIAGGAILLFHNVNPQMLKPGTLLQVGGPWDMEFGLFLRVFTNPLSYDLTPLLPPYTNPPIKWGGIAIFLLGGAIFYAPILVFRNRPAFAGALRNLVIMVWGMFATVYMFFLAGWIINQLNFWVFLILLVIVHKARGAPKIVLRLSRRSL